VFGRNVLASYVDSIDDKKEKECPKPVKARWQEIICHIPKKQNATPGFAV